MSPRPRPARRRSTGRSDGVDLVLLDYKLPDFDGVTVLKRLKELDPDTLVILLTAYASVETAVEAMKEGAYHFANKPFDLDDVAFQVSRALETTRLRREVRRLRASQAQPYAIDRIVGESTTDADGAQPAGKVAPVPHRPCCSPARAARARISRPKCCTSTALARIARS